MSELPPDAAALLARARNAHGPQQADRDRVLHGLHATLGISAAAAIAATTATTASATAAAVAEGGSIAPAAGGMLGWKSALLTWKAGKVMLATVAIGGAVGVGSASLPVRTPVHEQRSAELTKASRREAARPTREVVPGSALAAPAQAVDAETTGGAAAKRATQTAQPATRGAEVVTRERDLVAATQAKSLDQAVASPTAHTQRDEQGHSEANAAPSAALAAALPPAVALPRASTRASEPERSERRARRERRAHRGRSTSAVTRAGAPSSAPQEPVTSSESSAAPSPRDDGSRGEVSLLRSALASVRDGNGQQALSLLSEHAALYPSGAFSTERRGLRVLALCAAGRSAEGQREQAAFLREAGDSPIAARVRSACSDREP